MRILKVAVDWNFGYGKTPSLIVTIDKCLSTDKFKFVRKNEIYYAENDGQVMFYSYNAPGGGFGGGTITINMADGKCKDLIGPWSSRSSYVNMLGFGPSIDVQFKCDPSLNNGRTGMPGHCTVKSVKDYLDRNNAHFEIYKYIDTDDGEFSWRPRLKPELLDHYIAKLKGGR